MIDTDKKIKVVALFGESASGKDTIQKWLVSNNKNFKGIISCTTRPMRDNEEDGVDYHFLSIDEFEKNIDGKKMLEYTKFNNWYYGTNIKELKKNKVNVGVFNIAGIHSLLQDSRLEVTPVYVFAPNKTRLLRALNREDNPNCYEICRRFLADTEDFHSVDFKYLTFHNDEETLNEELLSNFVNLII